MIHFLHGFSLLSDKVYLLLDLNFIWSISVDYMIFGLNRRLFLIMIASFSLLDEVVLNILPFLSMIILIHVIVISIIQLFGRRLTHGPNCTDFNLRRLQLKLLRIIWTLGAVMEWTWSTRVSIASLLFPNEWFGLDIVKVFLVTQKPRLLLFLKVVTVAVLVIIYCALLIVNCPLWNVRLILIMKFRRVLMSQVLGIHQQLVVLILMIGPFLWLIERCIHAYLWFLHLITNDDLFAYGWPSLENDFVLGFCLFHVHHICINISISIHISIRFHRRVVNLCILFVYRPVGSLVVMLGLLNVETLDTGKACGYIFMRLFYRVDVSRRA